MATVSRRKKRNRLKPAEPAVIEEPEEEVVMVNVETVHERVLGTVMDVETLYQRVADLESRLESVELGQDFLAERPGYA